VAIYTEGQVSTLTKDRGTKRDSNQIPISFQTLCSPCEYQVPMVGDIKSVDRLLLEAGLLHTSRFNLPGLKILRFNDCES